jgi:hypothetical protein
LWSGSFQTPGEYRAANQSREVRTLGRESVSRPPVAAPAGACAIKGNQSRRGPWIYHLPGMASYADTKAEAMFCSEAEAQAAGYRRARSR